MQNYFKSAEVKIEEENPLEGYPATAPSHPMENLMYYCSLLQTPNPYGEKKEEGRRGIYGEHGEYGDGECEKYVPIHIPLTPFPVSGLRNSLGYEDLISPDMEDWSNIPRLSYSTTADDRGIGLLLGGSGGSQIQSHSQIESYSHIESHSQIESHTHTHSESQSGSSSRGEEESTRSSIVHHVLNYTGGEVHDEIQDIDDEIQDINDEIEDIEDEIEEIEEIEDEIEEDTDNIDEIDKNEVGELMNIQRATPKSTIPTINIDPTPLEKLACSLPNIREYHEFCSHIMDFISTQSFHLDIDNPIPQYIPQSPTNTTPKYNRTRAPPPPPPPSHRRRGKGKAYREYNIRDKVHFVLKAKELKSWRAAAGVLRLPWSTTRYWRKLFGFQGFHTIGGVADVTARITRSMR